jgi:hypothetical protein
VTHNVRHFILLSACFNILSVDYIGSEIDVSIVTKETTGVPYPLSLLPGPPSSLSNRHERRSVWGFSGRSMKLITHLHVVPRLGMLGAIRGCIQKFPDWPHGARTANGTVLCH